MVFSKTDPTNDSVVLLREAQLPLGRQNIDTNVELSSYDRRTIFGHLEVV